MMKHMTWLFVITAVIAFVAAAQAGHSRFPYVDGGQSADGRYVVTAELIVPKSEKPSSDYFWQYTWKDTKTGQAIEGKLLGLKSGRSQVGDPVHAHIFVAPGGETFAVWNPNVLARYSGPSLIKDVPSADVRNWEGFSHRLTIYKKSGEVVKRLDLKDFLVDKDWSWIFCYQNQVYWQSGYPPLTRDNAPRVGYSLYLVSPDYTVLETAIGATAEATAKAKERGVVPPPPRKVRVDLVTGEFLDAAKSSSDLSKQPGRPFQGEPLTRSGDGDMRTYVPSLDPVRVAGRFVAAPPK